MPNQIEEFKDELVTKLKKVPEFRNNVFYIFDLIEMLELKKEGIKTPYIGVMWEGRKGIDKKGLSTVYTYKVLRAEAHRRTTSTDRKEDSTKLLNKIATGIVAKQAAPSCRLWEFYSDGPVTLHEGMLVYEQVWKVTGGLL